MQCREFLQHAERWMEGERDAHASAHLKSCSNCSALIADLEMISSSAGVLSEAEPPARVWVSLRNQLEAEGLIRETAVAVAPSRSRFLFGLRPALASAFVAVVVFVGGFWALRNTAMFGAPPQAVQLTDPSRDGREVLAELAMFAPLAKASMPEMHEHNPAVTVAYRQNLEIVDNAIAMCEKTVKEQPRNEAALEYLRAAYQQKADLLASMSQRGALGD